MKTLFRFGSSMEAVAAASAPEGGRQEGRRVAATVCVVTAGSHHTA